MNREIFKVVLLYKCGQELNLPNCKRISLNIMYIKHITFKIILSKPHIFIIVFLNRYLNIDKVIPRNIS